MCSVSYETLFSFTTTHEYNDADLGPFLNLVPRVLRWTPGCQSLIITGAY